MNLQSIPAHSQDVISVATNLAARGGWTFTLYDSDLPRSESNAPSVEWEAMDNPFGMAVHLVTFKDNNGKRFTSVAGLMAAYPNIAWTELSQTLQVAPKG